MFSSSDQVVGDELRSICGDLLPFIDATFRQLGFSTNDGVRFFRRKGHLLHYFKLVIKSLRQGDDGARTDGNHIGFHFGEALDLAPGLLIGRGKTEAAVVAPSTGVYPITKSSHFPKASRSLCTALQDIDQYRWTQIQSENEYVDFHLRCAPSMEKVYLLTAQEKHDEANAWLRLLVHDSRALRAASSNDNTERFDICKDPPGEAEATFSLLSLPQRVRVVEAGTWKNIERNDLGFLYETSSAA